MSVVLASYQCCWPIFLAYVFPFITMVLFEMLMPTDLFVFLSDYLSFCNYADCIAAGVCVLLKRGS